MPRQPRLDAPGLLQHVMARGIERRKIFWDGKDRKETEIRSLRSEIPRTLKARREKMIINSANELRVYKTAYALAMEIFEISKSWPPEERYSLTDQIRRSSRSVCSNLREAWAKRRYEAHFVSKLTDSDGENSETDTRTIAD